MNVRVVPSNAGFSREQLKKLVIDLDPGLIKSREADGRRLDYIEGWFAIAEANRIFGYAGWDRQMVHFEKAFQQVGRDTSSCGYVARIKIMVRAGTTLIIREGTGYGQAFAKTLGDAQERALKAAETDATKRALATFGTRFGLGLYDKDRGGVGAAPGMPARTARTATAPTVPGPAELGRTAQGPTELALAAPRPTALESAAPGRTAPRPIAPDGGVGDNPVQRSKAGRGFVLMGAGGEPLAVSLSAEAFCTGLRQLIEAARDSAELDGVMAHNRPGLALLRQQAPSLVSRKAEHYADIVERLAAKRRVKLEGSASVVATATLIATERAADGAATIGAPAPAPQPGEVAPAAVAAGLAADTSIPVAATVGTVSAPALDITAAPAIQPGDTIPAVVPGLAADTSMPVTATDGTVNAPALDITAAPAIQPGDTVPAMTAAESDTSVSATMPIREASGQANAVPKAGVVALGRATTVIDDAGSDRAAPLLAAAMRAESSAIAAVLDAGSGRDTTPAMTAVAATNEDEVTAAETTVEPAPRTAARRAEAASIHGPTDPAGSAPGKEVLPTAGDAGTLVPTSANGGTNEATTIATTVSAQPAGASHTETAHPKTAAHALNSKASRLAAGFAIDKSLLAHATTRRIRSKAHLTFVASKPCLICGELPVHAHHLTFAQARGLSVKVSDEFTVPLCPLHHNQCHAHRNERAFWRSHRIEPLPAALALWQQSLAERALS